VTPGVAPQPQAMPRNAFGVLSPRVSASCGASRIRREERRVGGSVGSSARVAKNVDAVATVGQAAASTHHLDAVVGSLLPVLEIPGAWSFASRTSAWLGCHPPYRFSEHPKHRRRRRGRGRGQAPPLRPKRLPMAMDAREGDGFLTRGTRQDRAAKAATASRSCLAGRRNPGSPGGTRQG